MGLEGRVGVDGLAGLDDVGEAGPDSVYKLPLGAGAIAGMEVDVPPAEDCREPLPGALQTSLLLPANLAPVVAAVRAPVQHAYHTFGVGDRVRDCCGRVGSVMSVDMFGDPMVLLDDETDDEAVAQLMVDCVVIERFKGKPKGKSKGKSNGRFKGKSKGKSCWGWK